MRSDADGNRSVEFQVRAPARQHAKRNLVRMADSDADADSVPEAEYQESVNKAKALMSAAEETVRFASVAKRG